VLLGAELGAAVVAAVDGHRVGEDLDRAAHAAALAGLAEAGLGTGAGSGRGRGSGRVAWLRGLCRRGVVLAGAAARRATTARGRGGVGRGLFGRGGGLLGLRRLRRRRLLRPPPPERRRARATAGAPRLEALRARQRRQRGVEALELGLDGVVEVQPLAAQRPQAEAPQRGRGARCLSVVALAATTVQPGGDDDALQGGVVERREPAGSELPQAGPAARLRVRLPSIDIRSVLPCLDRQRTPNLPCA
jgi:hypothetical protein